MPAKTTRSAAIRVTVLMTALGVPASTSALPSDMYDLDADLPRASTATPVPSLSDSPAVAAPPIAAPVVEGLPGQAAVVTGPASSANPLWAIPLTKLSDTRERPIFSPSRRPPPTIAAAVPVQKAPPPPRPVRIEPPQLALVGTISSDNQSFGIFIDQSSKAALRLRIGEDYQGWKLQSVQGRDATLQRDQQTAVLSLAQPGTGAPPAVAAAGRERGDRGADGHPATRRPPALEHYRF